MKRRRAIQTLASAAASLPLLRVSLYASTDTLAQVGELSADHVMLLRDIAGTVLPSSIGRQWRDQAVDDFLRWIRDYQEDVALSHGYGDPRLVKSGPHPSPGYSTQMNALQQSTKARGTSFSSLPVEVRRGLLDEAFKAADVRNLPGRPDGKHVVADLMAHYFRSSGANDLCYNARIGRNSYRAIRVTTVRPQRLG